MAKEKICGIYKITNLVNGKVYIGQSVDIYKRWNDHKRTLKTPTEKHYNYPLYCAFRKYGLENFSFEIVEECSEEKLNKREVYYIELYRTYINWEDSNGYNQTLGGGGILGKELSEESKIKIGRANKGKLTGGNNPSAKKVICENIEFSCAKECSEYYGVKHSTLKSWLNHSNDMPEEWYNKGLRYFDETMEDYKIQKDCSGENHTKSIPVYCEGKKFSNVGECSEYYGINKATMSNWLCGNNNMPQEWYDKCLHQEGKSMDCYKVQTGALTGVDNPNSRPVYCDGIKYNSVKEFTQKYNLVYTTVMNWLHGNSNMPQEWYDRGLHFEGENMCDYKIQTGILNGKNHPLSKTVLCEDREFDSIKECADYYGVNKATMTDWVTHKHKMPRKWYDKGLHLKGEDMCSYEYDNKSKVVVCEGIKFYSIRECAEYYGVSKDAMIKWLSGRNKMPQEFKDKGLKYYE